MDCIPIVPSLRSAITAGTELTVFDYGRTNKVHRAICESSYNRDCMTVLNIIYYATTYIRVFASAEMVIMVVITISIIPNLSLYVLLT